VELRRANQPNNGAGIPSNAGDSNVTQVEVNETLIELMQKGHVLPVRINGEYRFALAEHRHKIAAYLVPVQEAIDYLRRCNEMDAAEWN
jgi:hypothetical protein